MVGKNCNKVWSIIPAILVALLLIALTILWVRYDDVRDTAKMVTQEAVAATETQLCQLVGFSRLNARLDEELAAGGQELDIDTTDRVAYEALVRANPDQWGPVEVARQKVMALGVEASGENLLEFMVDSGRCWQTYYDKIGQPEAGLLITPADLEQLAR